MGKIGFVSQDEGSWELGDFPLSFANKFTEEWKADAPGQWFLKMAVQQNHLGKLLKKILIPNLTPSIGAEFLEVEMFKRLRR